MIEIEICCTDVASVAATASAGVDRVELCANIAAGGVTPSAGLIQFAVRRGIPSVNVLIRPRGGNFVYSSEEVEVMVADITEARRLGATGVVIGALTSERKIDLVVMRRLCEAAEGLERIVSRAIDLTPDPLKALEEVVALGCHRVLTSGGAVSVDTGAEMLRRMTVRAAGSGVVIMAGGGVRPHNIPLLREHGVRAFHTTAHVSGSHLTEKVAGFGCYQGSYSDPATIAEIVALRDTFNNM
ncbi:MAG: copper homeostasis protein CutC [Muribaculaceae bacterium]|nr:copper homeostasis protein CutC [Muribaculaceae bacterium]